MRQQLLGHVEERKEVQVESLTYHSTSIDAIEREIEHSMKKKWGRTYSVRGVQLCLNLL